MARPDEISSTEKLLDTIRDDREPPSGSPDASSSSIATPEKIRPFFSQAISLGKKIHIGVDIGYLDLRLAKIDRSSDKKTELIDYRIVPFDPGITKESPQFPQFLKSALTEFCGPAKKCEIWSNISAAGVEPRYLRIPKVPKKQIANAAYWSFKKETPLDEKEQIFDFLVLDEITDGGIEKIEVMAYAAPKQEIAELRDTFSKSGFPLKGVTDVPFTFQDLIKTDWLGSNGDSVCCLYIGRGWSRIDIFSKGNLVLSRGIKAGTTSMIETLKEELNSNRSEISLEIIDSDGLSTTESTESRPEIDTEQATKILYAIIRDSSQPIEKETLSDLQAEIGSDITEDEMFKMTLPALERMINQVSKTLEHYALNFGNDRVGKIFVSGRLSVDMRVVKYIGDKLEITGEAVDPFSPKPPFSIKPDIPETASDRSTFAPAVGLALSSNAISPNFIFTYEDKDRLIRVDRINRLVFGAFLIMMVLCIGFYQWQGYTIVQKEVRVNQLQQQLYKYIPRVDQNSIQRLVAQIKSRKKTLKSHGEKYLGLSVISELSNLTPTDIQLLSLSADLPRVLKGKKEENVKKTLILEGIVNGNRKTFESILARYMLKLNSSLIFNKPSITERSLEIFDDKKVLRFTTHLELI